MEKPARTEYPVHPLIEKRWSPRAFADRPVEMDKLRSCLEAARWAASCFNEQPWRFIVARREDADEFQRMVDCLKPGNQGWASGAAVLLLSVAALKFARNDGPNRHAVHDVGIAAGQFVIQATVEGLSVHQMAGFDPDKARETYAIPEGFEPVAVIAVGYRGDPDRLPDDLKVRELAPRVRRPQSEFVFAGSFGKRFD